MFSIIKQIAEFVIPVGTEAIFAGITSGAVKNCGKLTKIAAGISSLVLGYWVGDKATDYFIEEMEDFKDKWDQYKIGGES